jgi:superfamily I DNA/RNA helicase/RecB family exonuclease
MSVENGTVYAVTIRGFQHSSERPADRRPPVLDPAQAAVIALPTGDSAAVIGAPGTGKTTTLVELVADRVENHGWAPDEVVVLTPNRATATHLRDVLSLRLGIATNGPMARTTNSLAFELVRHAAKEAGAAAPRLLTGGDQDQIIKELLQGHIDEGGGPDWPAILGPDVRQLRGFRTELRELMMRATEFDVSPERLRDLGRRHARAEWIAAADFIDEYFEVLGQAQQGALDAAELMAFATEALRADISEKLSRLRLVIVDDLQETTEATIGLLRVFAQRGVAVVAFGDPDVATNAFRSGERDALGRLSTRLGLPGLRTFILGTAHRQGAELRALTSVVTDRIGTAAAGRQHAAVAGGESFEEPIVTVHAATPAKETAAIARLFRQHHLLRGIPFGRMAVIVRSGSHIRPISRALALAEVPTRTLAGGTALRDDHAARSLLSIVDVALGRTPLTPAIATEMLLGPFGGFDRLALRRLRVALRAEELAGGGNRGSDDLLVEALEAPGRFATIDHRIGRNADRIAQTLAATAELARDDASIEQLLWLVWERSGLAAVWHDQALGTGLTAADANRNLDGVMALFTAARRFTERRPGDGARLFIDDLLGAEVPEDTLAPQTSGQSVLVTTPSGAVGMEFDVVAVAGLQEGVWPNLRIRGSLLYPQDLVDATKSSLVVAANEADAGAAAIDDRRQVLGDELRMFALAVSRATTQVILTAVSNEDEAASVLMGLVPANITVALDTSQWHPLSLRGITGRLRRELVRPRSDLPAGFLDADRHDAAAALAVLAREAVPGADPGEWHGMLAPSTTGPLHDLDDPDVTVAVSPSKLEAFEASPLNWFIDVMSGTQSSTAMGLGTIVHWAMETATDPSLQALWQAVESRWSELVFESPWLAEKQKRAARVLTAGLSEYLHDFSAAGKTLVSAEPSFGVVVGRAKLNGKIDRVEQHDDGAIVIVDLKTGRAETSQSKIDANAQLGAYQLAYDHGVLEQLPDGHRPGGAKLLYVSSGVRGKLYREAVQAPLAGEQLDELRLRIERAAVGMAAAEFAGLLTIDSYGSGNDPRYRIHLVKAVSA